MNFEGDIFRLLMIVLLLANDRQGSKNNLFTDINQLLILGLLFGSSKYPFGVDNNNNNNNNNTCCNNNNNNNNVDNTQGVGNDRNFSNYNPYNNNPQK